MIVATGIELRAGARLLVEDASFRIDAGDRIGLVGRNGAGKTTLTKVLAGEGAPAAGTVTLALATGPWLAGRHPERRRSGMRARSDHCFGPCRCGAYPIRCRARRTLPHDRAQTRQERRAG